MRRGALDDEEDARDGRQRGAHLEKELLDDRRAAGDERVDVRCAGPEDGNEGLQLAHLVAEAQLGRGTGSGGGGGATPALVYDRRRVDLATSPENRVLRVGEADDGARGKAVPVPRLQRCGGGGPPLVRARARTATEETVGAPTW